jgi:hypothetical protein
MCELDIRRNNFHQDAAKFPSRRGRISIKTRQNFHQDAAKLPSRRGKTSIKTQQNFHQDAAKFSSRRGKISIKTRQNFHQDAALCGKKMIKIDFVELKFDFVDLKILLIPSKKGFRNFPSLDQIAGDFNTVFACGCYDVIEIGVMCFAEIKTLFDTDSDAF